jgi:hypothetical protein
MSSPRIQEAAELVETISAALAAAELDQVTATTDAGKVPSASRNGVVLVAPPALAFPTWTQVETTWTLHVVAGPATDYLAAWATIDAIIQALFDAQTLNFDEAEPGQFAQQNGSPLPAYTITLNP